RLCGALCGGVPCLRRLSLWLCAVDGEQALALRGPDCGSGLSGDRRQYLGVRGPRREFEDVPGFPAVWFLHAPALVDQALAGCLCFALGNRDGTGLCFVSLDAARRSRSDQQAVVGVVARCGSNLVQSALARRRVEYRRLYLEVDAFLVAYFPRSADEDPPRPL